MKVEVEFKKLPNVEIDEKDLPALSEAIEGYCWFVYEVKRITIRG